MAKYLVLNLVVLALAFALARPKLKLAKGEVIALCALLGLTAIFDSMLVLAKVIDYNPSFILGLSIWAAPLEDFAYPILAFFLTPVLWRYFGGKHADKH